MLLLSSVLVLGIAVMEVLWVVLSHGIFLKNSGIIRLLNSLLLHSASYI